MPSTTNPGNSKDDIPDSVLSSVREELHTDDDLSIQSIHRAPTLMRNEALKKSGQCEGTRTNDKENSNGMSLLKSLSRCVTVNDTNRDLVVPRNKRTGFLSQFLIVQQYKDAREYPKPMKRLILLVVAMVSIAGPMGTSIIFPCITSLEQDFHTTGAKVNISVGVYLLGLGIFPIWWSSFALLKGRRWVYIISFTCLVGFSIGCALCKNISAFIVLRVLCGASSSSAQTVGAGVMADLFIPEERGKQIGLFYLGSLMAPLLSPIIGSLLVNRWNWKSTQWFMVIFAVFNLIALIFLLPETLRTVDEKMMIKEMIKESKTDDNPLESNPASIADEKGLATDNSDDEDLAERILTRNPSAVSNLHRVKSYYKDSNVSEDDYDDQEGILDPIMPQMTKIITNRSTRNKPRTPQQTEAELQKQERELQKQIDENLGMKKKTGKFKDIDYKNLFYIYGLKPLKSLHYLRYPPVALAIVFSAISFAILYFVNLTLQHKYSAPPYNFKKLYIGLLYIPNSVTYIIASIYGGKWVDRLLINYKEKYGFLAPEARISYNVVVAVVLFPISLLIFGWCLDKKTFWVFPLIGTALFGFASMMIIGATVSYLVDSVGSVGVAVNNLIRMILAAIACFVTDQMLDGMGTGWAFTMLSFVVIAASSVLVVLKKKSNYWRENFDLEALHRKVKD